MKCPDCGNELVEVVNGRDHIFNCKECGTSFCTSTQDEIDNDITIYELSIAPNNVINSSNINCIKKIFGVFSLEAKEILTNGRLVIKGYAYKIKKYLEVLKSSSISYIITPDYPYSISK